MYQLQIGSLGYDYIDLSMLQHDLFKMGRSTSSISSACILTPRQAD